MEPGSFRTRRAVLIGPGRYLYRHRESYWAVRSPTLGELVAAEIGRYRVQLIEARWFVQFVVAVHLLAVTSAFLCRCRVDLVWAVVCRRGPHVLK